MTNGGSTVLDGMARMLDVLHDISDSLQRLTAAPAQPPREISEPTPSIP
ncbi:MAG TPA: hypothetical protein VGL75_06370 [Acidothermaceae bacterium]